MTVMGTGSVCLLLLLLMAGVMGMMGMVVGAQGDREGEGDGTVMTRESVKAQIDQLESFLEAKSGSVHPSQLQNHWLQLAMLYQVYDARFHDGGSYKAPALEAFDTALETDMDDATKSHALYRKGLLLRMMSRADESVEVLQESLALADTLEREVETLTALGDSFNMLGNAEEAVNYLNKSIHLDTSNFEGYYNLVNIMKEQGNATQPSDWEALYVDLSKQLQNYSRRSNKNKSPGYVVSAYWALFIAAEKLKKYDEAWRHLERAHADLLVSRDPEAASLAVIEERSMQIQQIFTKNFFPTGVGSKSKTPVFIVGMMRSGSTLIETILDAHPSIYGIGEDSIFNSNLNVIRDAIVAAHVKQQETQDPTVLRDAIASQAKRVLKLTASKVKEGDGVKQKGKIKRVVDKMLFNYRNIGFIHMIFPNAAIIHTVRDPMDTILSCFTHKFDDLGLEWAFDADALVKQFEQYLTIIAHFKKVISEDRIIDVSFERLVKDPETHVRELIEDKMSLEWDSSVLQFHTLNRSIHTHSINQVRKGIYSSGIGKWRKFATQLEPIRQLLLPIMKRMKKNKELPFPNEINWLLDPDFPYEEPIPGSSGSDSNSSSKCKKNSSSSVSSSTPMNARHVQDQSPPSKDAPRSLKNKNVNTDKKSAPTKQKPAHSVLQTKQIEQEWRARHGGGAKDNFQGDFIRAVGKGRKGQEGNIGKKRMVQRFPGEAAESGRRDEEIGEMRYGKERKRGKVFIGKVRGKKRMKQRIDSGNTAAQFSQNSPPIHEVKKPKEKSQKKKDRAYPTLVRVLEGLKVSLSANQMVNRALPAVLDALQYPSGDETLDTLTAYGVCLFNMQNLDEAIEILEPVVAYQKNLYSAVIGLASAYALKGNLPKAFEMMNHVTNEMDKDDWTSDICERRAQIANALEKWDDALESLNCAIRLNPLKITSYQMRANIFVKKRFFQRAYSDLQFVLAEMKDTDLDSQTYVIYILLAKCENQFGNVSKGIEYLRTGLAATKSKLTSSSRADLYLELVINYLTISDVKNIEKYMSKIFLLNEGHGLAHGYNGLFHQNRGEAAKSMVSYHKVLEGNPKEIQSMHFIGLGYFAQGKYLDAMTWFDKLLEVDPNHYAWCLKEMAWYRLQKLDTALDNYNPDTDLHWLLRDAWIRRSPKSEYCRGNFCHKNLKLVSQADIRAVKSSGKSISIPMSDYYDSEQSDKFRQFLNMTSIISSWIQVDSPGFLIHKRQHRMFGLVVLQMAELLQKHYNILRSDKSSGLLISNQAVSMKHLESKEYFDNYIEQRFPDDNDDHHFMGWRDLFDLSVKWRQLAEPHDVVLWIDCTQAQEEGNEKVGLQTYLYHNGKNTRYYPYFNQTFSLLRTIFPKGYYQEDGSDLIIPSLKEAKLVQSSTTLLEVLKVSNSFFCMTEIQSLASPGRTMTGTRIAISRADPEGEALFISTPTDKERYVRYTQEFTFLFKKLEDFVISNMTMPVSCAINGDDSECNTDLSLANVDEGVKICLEIFYYWVNFAPLSRGSAATGYSALVGCIASLGEVPAEPLPRGVQIDWLGMLSTTPGAFVDKAFPYVAARIPLSTALPACWTHAECRVSDVFITARDILHTLNLDNMDNVDGSID